MIAWNALLLPLLCSCAAVGFALLAGSPIAEFALWLNHGEPLPATFGRESFERLAVLGFYALYLPCALAAAYRPPAFAGDRLSGARLSAWLAMLPWAFLLLLFLFAAEKTPYRTATLSFADWSFFAPFRTVGLAEAGLALLLAALWFLEARGDSLARKLGSAILVAGIVLYARFAWLLAFTVPPQGFALDADTHHHAVVLAPIVDFLLVGGTDMSQYGGYYVWVALLAKLAGVGFADVYEALCAAFFVFLFFGYVLLHLAVRNASGSNGAGVMTVFAAVFLSGMSTRGFTYLQIEPIRHFFPLLFLWLATTRAAANPKFIGAAALLLPLALHWNTESGLAAAGSWFMLCAARAAEPKVLPACIARYFVLPLLAGGAILYGVLQGIGFLVHADPAASDPLATVHALIRFGLAGFRGEPMPGFHFWQLAAGLACLAVALGLRDRRYLASSPRQRFYLAAGVSGLLLLVYYSGISVPGNLRAFIFPAVAVCTVLALECLSSVRARFRSGATEPAISFELSLADVPALAAVPWLALCVWFAAFGMRADGWWQSQSTASRVVAARDFALIERICPTLEGADVAMVSQNAWLWSLACRRPFNIGRPHQGMVITPAAAAKWRQALNRADVIVLEADAIDPALPDYARMAEKKDELDRIVTARNFAKLELADADGRRMMFFMSAENRRMFAAALGFQLMPGSAAAR
ncbi:MAG: hypothetical protein HZA63_11825 [Rhodocyclales bacterium]|nr:hypothetical protein [Rhodocyclales bacterium]